MAEEVRNVALSTFHATPPLNRPEQPSFFNGVVEVETNIPPRALKCEVLRRVEAELGRVRSDDPWTARTIDLDIAIYDDLVIDEPDLRIPAPDITERTFLGRPIAEPAPEMVLPGTGRRAKDIAAALGDDDIAPLGEHTQSLKEKVGAGARSAWSSLSANWSSRSARTRTAKAW